LNLGLALTSMGRYEAAIPVFDRVLEQDPANLLARAKRLQNNRSFCNWEQAARDLRDLPRYGVEDEPASPFGFYAIEDNPERHLTRAKRFAERTAQPPLLPARPRPSARPPKLRIAYLSGDFQNHAMMQLMARLFEVHDRERFVWHAYSYGRAPHDAMRERLVGAFDVFTDISAATNKEAAQYIHEDAMDITIDLQGHTRNSRFELLAHRPSPIRLPTLVALAPPVRATSTT